MKKTLLIVTMFAMACLTGCVSRFGSYVDANAEISQSMEQSTDTTESPSMQNDEQNQESVDSFGPAPIERRIEGVAEWLLSEEGVSKAADNIDLSEFWGSNAAKEQIDDYTVIAFENGSFIGYVNYKVPQTVIDGDEPFGDVVTGDGCSFSDNQIAKIEQKFNGKGYIDHYSEYSAFMFANDDASLDMLIGYYMRCLEGCYPMS